MKIMVWDPVTDQVVDTLEIAAQIGGGLTGAATRQLRDALSRIHSGESPDEHGWLTRV